MDPMKIRSLAAQIIAEIDGPAPLPVPLPTPNATVIRITAGQSIQSAVDKAPAGSVLQLENTASFTGNLVIKKDIDFVPRVLAAPGRVTKAQAAAFPHIRGTVMIEGAADVRFSGGIAVQGTARDTTLVTDHGLRTVLDQVALLGSPNGQRRGVAANGTDLIVRNSHIDDIWHPDEDAQAICGWDGTNRVLIENNYLSATGQAVMFGGGDPANAGRSPTSATVRGNLLTKNPAWRAKSQRVKCALELKNIDGYAIEHNDLEYSGADDGHAGYLIVLTPRNQDGNAPYSAVLNGTIEGNIGRHSAGCILLLGYDTEPGRTSGPLKNLVIRRNVFEDIDGQKYPGNGWLLYVSHGPQDVTIEDLDVRGQNLGATGYFDGPPPVNMVLRLITAPKSYSGWKVDNGGSGLAAVRQYAPGIVIDPTVMDDEGWA